MADDVQWSWEAWSAAVAEMPSVGKLLALYESGAVSRHEVLNAVCYYCHDKPEIAAGVVQYFHDQPDESLRTIGTWLQDLLQQKYGDGGGGLR